MRNELHPLQRRCLRGLHHRALPPARFGLAGEGERGGRGEEARWREGGGSGGSLSPPASVSRGELDGGGRARENFGKFR